MSDPLGPMPADGLLHGSSDAHVDPSTLALLAETELDDASVNELAALLLADDPDLPAEWHVTALRSAARHIGSCMTCTGQRDHVADAIVALVTMPVVAEGGHRDAPLAPQARADAHVRAALDAVAATEPADREGGMGVAAGRAPRAGRRFTRDGSRWGGAAGGRSQDPAGSTAGGSSNGSSWSFARDRRLVLALAALLAIAVPLAVNQARRDRPTAAKVVDSTASESSPSARQKSLEPAPADTSAAAFEGRMDTASPSPSPSPADAETPGGAADAADAAPADNGPAEAGAATETATGATVTEKAEAPETGVSRPETRRGGAAPTTISRPAPPSVASASSSPPTSAARRRPSVPPPAAAPAPAAKRAAPTALPAAAPPAGGVSGGAASTVAATDGFAPSDGAPTDFGALGTFTDEDSAIAAFRAVMANRSSSPVALAAPSTTSPPLGAAPDPAATATATAPAPAPAAPPATPAQRPCAQQTTGAHAVALAEIAGASAVVAAFADPVPGRIQILDLATCAVRSERSR